MSDSNWQKLSSKTIYKNPWVSVREDQIIDPEGKQGVYAYLHTQASVFVIAENQDKKIYLVKQFRYPTQSWSWELPGGGADPENLLQSAKDELHQELNLNADTWDLLGKIQAFPGSCDEWQYIFYAQDTHEETYSESTDDFIVEKAVLSWEEIDSWIEQGKISDSQTLASLHIARLKL